MTDDRLIYPADLATACASRAGQPYRPSNGLEGDLFYEAWCADCVRDAAIRADPVLGTGCAILAATMAHGLDDPGYPKEWRFGADGQPRCIAHTTDPAAPWRCAATPDLFASEDAHG